MEHGSVLLRKWREELDLSQSEAANILSSTSQQVSHWETCQHLPDADRRFDIAKRTKGKIPAESWSMPG